MVTSQDEVTELLAELQTRYKFNVEIEHIPRAGDAVKVVPSRQGAPEIVVFSVDGVVESIQFGGGDLYADIDIDRDRKWLRELEEILDAIMSVGFSMRVWRYRHGRQVGSRAEIMTPSGRQRFTADLAFWPFTRLFHGELITYEPYDRVQP